MLHRMKSAMKALVLWVITLEARAVLWKYRPFVVAVTGNVGKTSTKDAIATVLSAHGYVRASEKSLNSEFGVPLTILGCESGWNSARAWLHVIIEGLWLILSKNHYPNTLVLEVGADHPGDIQRIASWLRPNVALITGIPDTPVHVEFFDSSEALAREKEALIAATPAEGHIMVNGDDALVAAMLPRYRSAIVYGRSEGAAMTSSHEEVVYDEGRPSGIRFRVNYKGSSVPVAIRGAVGVTHVYPVLAACAVASVCGIDLVSAARALESHRPPKGRMALVPGKSGATIVDDTYNASPAATEAALKTLGGMTTTGKRIAILGDMLELGKHSHEEHRKIGEMVAHTADMLVVCGVRAQDIARSAEANGMTSDHIHTAPDSQSAGRFVQTMLSAHDVVLVKGSQGMRMERAVREVMADPTQAKEYLVRQDKEWLRR